MEEMEAVEDLVEEDRLPSSQFLLLETSLMWPVQLEVPGWADLVEMVVQADL
jgi:hypothetical protein